MQDVRFSAKAKAIKTLESSFAQILDKDRVWKDLVGLAQNDDRNIRIATADVLKNALSQMSEKDQGWRHFYDSLAPKKDAYIWKAAAYALGSAFSQFRDKDVAWKDLLTWLEKMITQ